MALSMTASPSTALLTEMPTTTPDPLSDITSVITRLTTFYPVVTSVDTDSRLKIYTIDHLPTECSSRWYLYDFSSGTPIITSGNYEEKVMGATVSPGYWRDCYPDAPATPNYSPAMCTGQYTLIGPGHIAQDPRPTTEWLAVCCPT